MTDHALARFKASRLSFGWDLIDTMITQRWQVSTLRWDLDRDGRGLAIYRIQPGQGRRASPLHFVVLSVLVPDEEWTPDAYARKFDIQASLIEGPVTQQYLETFRTEIQRKPTEGRADDETLAWVRANRSARAFDRTVSALASGRQPDPARLCQIGYLLRTEYYQSNGACGTRPFAAYGAGHPLGRPYASQSLGSYLLREFGNALVTHLARAIAPDAADLHPLLRRYIGLGNSTGVGLVLFAANHPRLMHRWIEIREQAIASIRRLKQDASGGERLASLLDRCIRYRAEDMTNYAGQFLPGPALAEQLGLVRTWLGQLRCASPPAIRRPWDYLCGRCADTLSAEALETLHSLLISAHPHLAGQLAGQSVVGGVDDLHPEVADVDPTMTTAELHAHAQRNFGWVTSMDTCPPAGRFWFWYKDQVGEYPGLLPRREARGGFADFSTDIPGLMTTLLNDLRSAPPRLPVGDFLSGHPWDRFAAQWVQTTVGLPYATVRMNMTSRNFEPMAVTRFVLEALKGFEKMQPIEAYGGRAIIMQGAPTAGEIASGTDLLWMYPTVPEVADESG